MTSDHSLDPRPDFVYVTYIAVPKEKVWEALTSAPLSEQYFFGTHPQSEWKVGGSIQLIRATGEVDVDGKLLACDPPNLLAYTWNTPTDKTQRAEPTAVSFKLDTVGATTRLTLTHSHLLAADYGSEADSPRGLNNGWPMIVASLKSLLETGRIPVIMGEQDIDKAREGG
jgi:uncharacterized protein YndB with AHSA1/START domain